VKQQWTKDEVFEVVKDNIRKVMFDLPDGSIDRSKNLKDLGANSLDRSEIAMGSMEALGLNFSLREFANVKNVDGLVDLLHEKLSI
jgi:acyl carrier protein